MSDWRRLGAYLSRHAEGCPRARRERLEWLGDAVLRDLVVRHVVRQGGREGEESEDDRDSGAASTASAATRQTV